MPTYTVGLFVLLLVNLTSSQPATCSNYTKASELSDPIFVSQMIPEFTQLCRSDTTGASYWLFHGWSSEGQMLLENRATGALSFSPWTADFAIDTRTYAKHPWWTSELIKNRILSSSLPKPCVLYNRSQLVFPRDVFSVMLEFVNTTTIRGIPILNVIRSMSEDYFGSNNYVFPVPIVGGAVRDTIVNKNVSDVDLVWGMQFDAGVFRIRDIFKTEGVVIDDGVFLYSGARGNFGMMKVSEISNSPGVASFQLHEKDGLDVGPFKAANKKKVVDCQTAEKLCLGTKSQEECLVLYQVCIKSGSNIYLYGFSYGGDADYRDYSINAVYMDLVNNLLIDCGAEGGVADMQTQRLRIQNPLDFADDLGGQFRFIRLLVDKGYSYVPGEDRIVCKVLLETVQSLSTYQGSDKPFFNYIFQFWHKFCKKMNFNSKMSPQDIGDRLALIEAKVLSLDTLCTSCWNALTNFSRSTVTASALDRVVAENEDQALVFRVVKDMQTRAEFVPRTRFLAVRGVHAQPQPRFGTMSVPQDQILPFKCFFGNFKSNLVLYSSIVMTSTLASKYNLSGMFPDPSALAEPESLDHDDTDSLQSFGFPTIYPDASDIALITSTRIYYAHSLVLVAGLSVWPQLLRNSSLYDAVLATASTDATKLPTNFYVDDLSSDETYALLNSLYDCTKGVSTVFASVVASSRTEPLEQNIFSKFADIMLAASPTDVPAHRVVLRSFIRPENIWSFGIGALSGPGRKIILTRDGLLPTTRAVSLFLDMLYQQTGEVNSTDPDYPRVEELLALAGPLSRPSCCVASDALKISASFLWVYLVLSHL